MMGIRPAKPSGERAARLLCDCGMEYVARLTDLLNGPPHVRSCGCYRRERSTELARRYQHLGQPRAAAASVTHGLTRHPLYSCWCNMMHRCENPEDKRFARYGGRGIRVCERWHDTQHFIEDVERELGPRPAGMSLDRIDNDGDYEPGNVRWATGAEQGRNKAKRAPRPDQPTLDVLREWPSAVSLPQANMALSISNTHGHRLAHRGEYPVPLIGEVPPWTVRTADLIRVRELSEQ
jgi:hypothetical protein